jgi:hypothetical protein
MLCIAGVVFSQGKYNSADNTFSAVTIDKAMSNHGSSKALIDSLHYDGDDITNAIGTGGAATFEVAAYFDAATLAPYNAAGNKISSLKYFINGVTNVTSTTVKIYADDQTTVLYSQACTPVEGWNEAIFTAPFTIPATGIYVGYEVVATGGYPAGVDAGPQDANANWILFGGSWAHLIDLGATLTFNWHIRAMVDDGVVLPTPQAYCNPLTWNAGDIEVAASATSGTFTLSNVQGGTLTCSGATGISAPFSTTFVPGAVSLGNGQSYTFTFDFDPTVAGTTNQTYTITTNGGNIVINLVGMAHDPYGVTLGTFENIADFELTFNGWDMIDNDASTTYGFSGTTFTNSGYTGSYIIFNPATTSPAMSGTAIAPHGGAKYAACFAATTPPNDDWLITPQSAVIENVGSTFSMWVKSYVADYGLERYAVWVSTTDTQQASFTKISAGTYLEADTVWTQVTYPLDAYVGQQVYVAIQCVTNDAFIFMVDDVEFNIIIGEQSPVASEISIFPNPTNGRLNITNAFNADVTVYNLVGEVVLSASNINSYVDLSDLANGSYIVKVSENDRVITKHISLTR